MPLNNDYLWIEDPGHAWLRVKIEEVKESKADISSYSYISRDTGMAYLEEDCDAPAFLRAVGKMQMKFPCQHQQNTFIRSLESFS